MLIPFKINDELVKQLNVPQYVVDWNRIKILKLVDDMRFMATRLANMDLSSEALLAIKFYHLCLLAMPKIDSDGKVISIDPIAQCYDVSKEEIIAALDELSIAIKNWKGASWTPADFYNFLTQARNNKLYFARLNHTYSLGAGRIGVSPSDVVLYSLVINSSLNKASGVVADSSSLTMSFEKQIIYFTNELKTVMLDVNSPALPRPISDRFNIRDGSKEQLTYIGHSFTVISPKNKTPKLFDFLMLQADIDERYAALALSEFSLDVLFKCSFLSKADDGYTDVIEPNPLFGADPARFKNYSTIVYDGYGNALNRKAHVYIPINVEYYSDGYHKRKFTLHNGKSYSIPLMKISQKHYNRPIAYNDTATTVAAVFGAGAIRTEIPELNASSPFSLDASSLKFFRVNKNKYPFPLFYPRTLARGEYRVRNGYLYSDASSLYELTFLKLPDDMLDKLGTFVNLQIAIKDFKDDLDQGQVITETVKYYKGTTRLYDWVAPAFVVGRATPAPAYDEVTTSYFYENGEKFPFVHPITNKPILADQYFNELLFECIDVWGQLEKDLDKFFAPLKAKNDTAYQLAYKNFMRAEATIKGPEALAEYERKLKTGVFYTENNFTYWRPFTADEIKLLEKLKADAMRNAEIANQNEQIKIQNQLYQDKANEEALRANQLKLAEAQAMARTMLRHAADDELSKIIAPTVDQMIADAEKEGGYPTDALLRWVEKNPNYYLREDVLNSVNALLEKLTNIEQKVATALVTNVIAEVKITKAFEELFIIKG